MRCPYLIGLGCELEIEDMANIVALGAGEKGRLLLAQWGQGRGGHTTSDSVADVPDANVVLIDVNAIDGGFEAIASQLAGKVVIDCSNPQAAGDLRGGTPSVVDIAARCPAAHVAKALNAIAPEALSAVFARETPSNDGSYLSAFFCTDDAHARQIVCGLLDEVYLDPVDCGPLSNATLLDALGVLEGYLAAKVFKPPFALVVSRQPIDRSPLDRWM